MVLTLYITYTIASVYAHMLMLVLLSPSIGSSAPCSDGEYDFVEWTTYFAEDAGLQNYIAVVRQCLDRLWHTACLDEWSADGDTLCELSSRDPAAFGEDVVLHACR